MSKYTTELRFICEHDAGLYESKGYNNVDEILQACHDKIFSFNYPIFDESYRSVLECKILKHFYTREICAETVGLWKLFLDARMNEIMPYYNKLYNSELLQFNPLYDTDYTREMDRDGTRADSESSSNDITHGGTVSDSGTASNTRTNNQTESATTGGQDERSTSSAEKNDHWDYYSDTPQGTVTNLANLTYLTDARHITDDGTGSTSSEVTEYGRTNTVLNSGIVDDNGTNSNTRTFNNTDSSIGSKTGSITTTDDYIEHVSGKMPGQSMAKMLMEFRQTFLNIDKQIIEELNDLFLGLW